MVCLVVCEHASSISLEGKQCRGTDFCIQHVYTRTCRHMHTPSFPLSINSSGIHLPYCSAAYQCFGFRQEWQWLVHHPSLAHWKENNSTHITHSQKIWHHQPISDLSSDIRIPVLVSSRSGLSMQEQGTIFTLHAKVILPSDAATTNRLIL